MFAQRALDYANKVVNGEQLACKYVKQACQRFIDDLEREDLTLDIDDAERW